MKLREVNEYQAPSIESYYTGEEVKKDGVVYSIFDAEKAMELFDLEFNYLFGKKTKPTLIRKAITGEKIYTYVKDENGVYIEESFVEAKEGDYVFQNIDDAKDIYIPQNFDMSEYSPVEEGEQYTYDFKQFIRKSDPVKILYKAVKRPTLIIVKSWGDYEQFLGLGATLKCEGEEIVGINEGGFESWSIIDENGNIIEEECSNIKDKIEILF